MNSTKITNTTVAIIICEAAGVVGSFFTASSIQSWYVFLNKPSLAPPNWVFGPVWTTLFALMGIALALVWEKRKTRISARTALIVFGVQLVLNVLWSLIFFGFQSPGIAFAEIVVLWLSIAVSIVLFLKISRTAGALLVPYIMWVSFASYLNYMIWMLN